ncbi:extracellular solute-binding protein [Asanoa sp. NPDC049573]|uniref:extracellular solute-binding protein n=1 Tax=Asanoa sp. NPDC049573 TaxID=3155396 RepID=UPI00343F6CFA
MIRPSRRRLGLATILAASLAAAGCGTAGPGSGGSGSESATAWILTGTNGAPFQASFDAWNKAHPDEQIKVQAFENDAYKQKIRTAVGAGQAPTLIYGWAGGVLKSYVDAQAVDDLTTTVEPGVTARFLPSVTDVGRIGGKLYAVPNNGVKPALIYYNKDLFQKIGAQPPTTWDELMALVPRFTAAGIAPITVSGQDKWPLLMWEEYLVDRIGGPDVMKRILANEPNAWSDPAVIRANTMIQQLVDAGGFVNGFSSISTKSGADVALLYTGKAAMSLNLPSAYQTIQAGDPAFVSGGKLGYAPFPTVTDGKGDPKDVVGNPSNYWSISAKATAAEKKVALDYLKDGLATDAYSDGLLKVGLVPPAGGIEGKLAASADSAYLDVIYQSAQQAPSFQLSWDQALSPTQGDAVLTNLQQVFLKQITPEQFSANMNKTLGS